MIFLVVWHLNDGAVSTVRALVWPHTTRSSVLFQTCVKLKNSQTKSNQKREANEKESARPGAVRVVGTDIGISRKGLLWFNKIIHDQRHGKQESNEESDDDGEKNMLRKVEQDQAGDEVTEEHETKCPQVDLKIDTHNLGWECKHAACLAARTH